MQFPHPDSRILPHQILCTAAPLNSTSKELKRVVGSLVGLAVGDALGASVEFRPRQYLIDHPAKDMQNGGTWGLRAGQWTDDTSMALCLASSLITHRHFNSYDQMVRYKWWYKKGFLSSTGECFDIGTTTRTSLDEFCRRQNILKQHFRGMKDDDIDHLPLEHVRSVQNFNEYCGVVQQAGNGALMRLAPVPLFYFRHPEKAVKYAGESACLTHGDQKAVDACRYYAALIVAAIHGESKKELLNEQFYEKHNSWFGSVKLHDEVLRVARGSYKKQGGYKDGIRGKSYIINTLEAALWAFWSDENSFEKGVLKVINLGDDTDTTAAVYGQLAGAYYTISGIPSRWGEKLYANTLIICIAECLYVEGSRSENNMVQPHQPQKRQMTMQHQNQPTMSTSQFNQHQDSYKSIQQTSSEVYKDRIDYGIPFKQLQPQTYHTTHSNTNNSYSRQQKTKRDPSTLPPAGLHSGFYRR
ncbi:unnamed protein product [Rotaria sp. Silwood2]|nr:unnamed protein product [Rotaria sp. Silwood2]CAF2811390.1 unnamed protein product [Rotaria sp. Silwood2]CAF3078122.1 unnamed protein product [Rotaria sp. Silwood2]CAF3196357.1 unnamed protein product [Rotaria sp. Silwood2]CAF4173279.1 unnamed protein product [Rotaria sp. Silwood2]